LTGRLGGVSPTRPRAEAGDPEPDTETERVSRKGRRRRSARRRSVQEHVPLRADARLRPHHTKAIVAVEHSILAAAYHILVRGVPYNDLGADWFLRRHDPERHGHRLARQIEALGFSVTVGPSEAA
jgi:hypothetical protein